MGAGAHPPAGDHEERLAMGESVVLGRGAPRRDRRDPPPMRRPHKGDRRGPLPEEERLAKDGLCEVAGAGPMKQEFHPIRH